MQWWYTYSIGRNCSCVWCVMLNVWRVTINHSISDKLGGSEFYCYSCGDEIWSSHHMPTPSHHHQARSSAIICSLSASSFVFARILWLMVMVYHGMFGYSKIDLFTIEGWQSGVFFFSHDQPQYPCAGRLRLDCGDWKTLTSDNWQYLQSPAQNNDLSIASGL